MFFYQCTSYEILIADNQSQQVVPDVRLKTITIYPVKSCQGFSAQIWPLAIGGMCTSCRMDYLSRLHLATVFLFTICIHHVSFLFFLRFKI
jgi:hypothetical protein